MSFGTPSRDFKVESLPPSYRVVPRDAEGELIGIAGSAVSTTPRRIFG